MVDFAEPNNPGALMVKVSFSHFFTIKRTISVYCSISTNILLKEDRIAAKEREL